MVKFITYDKATFNPMEDNMSYFNMFNQLLNDPRYEAYVDDDGLCMGFRLKERNKEHNYLPPIKKVIFNDPATIVLWEDGDKTIVKCCKSLDKFSPMTGLAMAICKKALGEDYRKTFNKWVCEKPAKLKEPEGTITAQYNSGDTFTFSATLSNEVSSALWDIILDKDNK